MFRHAPCLPLLPRVIVCGLFATMLWAAHAGAGSSHGNDQAVLRLTGAILPCTALPDLGKRLECYATLCSMDFSCASSLAAAATEAGGPQSGMGVVRDLMSLGTMQATADGHDVAHVVGRQTAKHYGGTGEAFLLCTDDFFFGCYHGFFEGVLGESESALDAAIQICSGVTPDRKFFCFHGIGHGLMMGAGNDVTSALSTCDLLPTRMGREACWQGAFMENENAFSRGEARADAFDPADPMAPCNRMDATHRYQCYSQHGGYLLRAFSGSMALASKACADAGRPDSVGCIRHLAQHVSTRGTQEFLFGTFDRNRFAGNAAKLCRLSPGEYVRECLFTAAENFLYYDYIDDAARFCMLLGNNESPGCIRHVVSVTNVEGYPAWKRERFCHGLGQENRHFCDIRTLSLPATLQRMTRDLLLLDDTVQSFFASLSTASTGDPDGDAVAESGIAVRYAKSGFEPGLITVHTGERVEWINETGEPMWIASDDHPTHEKYAEFDPHKPLGAGTTWSFLFTEPGTWTYHDHLHPNATGTVLVRPQDKY